MLIPSPQPDAASSRSRVAQTLSTIVPIVAALLSFVVILWATYWSIRIPDVGLATVHGNSPVRYADLMDWTSDTFQAGDTILRINGVVVRDKFPLLATAKIGDEWRIEIADPQGHTREETVILGSPISWPVLAYRFSCLTTALLFWIASVTTIGVAGRKTRLTTVSTLYFYTSQLLVVVLASIYVSTAIAGDVVAVTILAAYWVGASAVHLHLHFPVSIGGKWIRGFVISSGYGFALIAASAMAGLWVHDRALFDRSMGTFDNLAGGWTALCLVVVLASLIVATRKKTSETQNTNTRLISTSTVVGMMPMLLLAVFPQLMLSAYAQTLSVTSLPLSIIALGYSYAILRYRLIQYDGLISRGIGYLFAIVLLATLLVAALIGLVSAGVTPSGPGFIVGVVALAAVLAVAFEPARRRIQDAVDGLFYRPYDDFRATLRHVDQALTAATDVAAWAQALCRQFASALDVRPVGLLFRVGKAFRLIAFDPDGRAAPLPVELDALSPLFAQLAAWAEPSSSADLRRALERPGLSEPDRLWLSAPVFDLWWPILAHGALQAVLVLGPKAGAFAPEQVELVALASRQIGAALENAQFARELEQLSRAALQTREDERKRVSRELHDHIIQPLVGLNFSLASARDIPAAAQARAQVADLITHVRRISADLRPPALDEVGLPAAARGLVRGFARQTGLDVDFVVRPDEDLDVPEPLASALFSALREALANVQRHAHASRVSVLIEAQAGWLTLVVHDDGVGFTPPARLGQLAPAGHFGLLGLQERLAALGGALTLHAEPDQGTRLECHAPLLS